MPVSAEVQYARLLRPFRARRLAQVLRPVHANAAALADLEERLLREPPATPEEARFELDKVRELLFGLWSAAQEADPLIRALSRDVDRDYRVAVDAMRAILAGLADSAPVAALAPSEPKCDLDPERGYLERKSPANEVAA